MSNCSSAEIPAAIQKAVEAAADEYSLIVAVPDKGPSGGQVQVAAKDASGNSVPNLYRGARSNVCARRKGLGRRRQAKIGGEENSRGTVAVEGGCRGQ